MRQYGLLKFARLCALAIPALVCVYQVGCLPDNSFAQVLSENITLTGGIIIQSITSIIFNTIFSLGAV